MMRKIKTCGIVIGIGVMTVTAAAFAQNTRGSSTVGGNPSRAGLCSRLEDKISNEVDNLSRRVGEMTQNNADRESRLQNEWDKFLNNATTTRAHQDADLAARFAKLEENAKNDAQKQAVSDFQIAVINALSAKRTAIDAAIQSFHDGIFSLLSTRKTTVDDSLATMKSAFETVADKAKADCASGVDSKTVRDNFLTAIKDARKSFVAARTGQDSFKSAMQKLVAAKQQAFKKAQADFQSAITRARDALKAALPTNEGENTSSSASSSSNQ